MSTAEKDVDEREKIHAKLREAKLIAEAADTAKSSFLATVSHEIRQILASPSSHAIALHAFTTWFQILELARP
jgi:signal transduction histidine kinase